VYILTISCTFQENLSRDFEGRSVQLFAGSSVLLPQLTEITWDVRAASVSFAKLSDSGFPLILNEKIKRDLSKFYITYMVM
jgi:hypothetical protein